jgi:ferric-dicitrate binding protein FerR (iron transport regulator)
MIRQSIRLAAVRRACKWCAFSHRARESDRTPPAVKQWLAQQHDYALALAFH